MGARHKAGLQWEHSQPKSIETPLNIFLRDADAPHPGCDAEGRAT